MRKESLQPGAAQPPVALRSGSVASQSAELGLATNGGPTAWAHIDMAAMDRAESDLPTVPKGPRGYGVRLFDQLVRSYEK